MAHRLDATDRRILRELMADGALTNVALAQKVGLSAPPCLRRVRALEDAGIIQGYTALVDEQALGFELTAFALVAAMLSTSKHDAPNSFFRIPASPQP